jgi:N-acetylglutamate synthase-like GNAT family acetyltransferase/SAM-dependent methyltransferase/DNA-binding MarR family transcriptional regulator
MNRGGIEEHPDLETDRDSAAKARRLREAIRLLARASGAMERDRGCCVELTFGECWALVEIARRNDATGGTELSETPEGRSEGDAASRKTASTRADESSGGSCPGLSVQELAAQLFLDKSAASRLADKLVRAGRVKRNPDGMDRRILRLSATAQGMEEARNIERDQDAFWLEILRGIPGTEWAGAVAGIEALSRSAIRLVGRRRHGEEPGIACCPERVKEGSDSEMDEPRRDGENRTKRGAAGEATSESGSGEALRESIARRYAEAVRSRREGSGKSCCGGGGREGGSCCGERSSKKGKGPGITENLYDPEALKILGDAAGPSFGCGNPGTLASLREGETVVDLGSGAGLDALFASLAVGPGGRVIGVDMTEAMLEEARENARRFGAENVTFLRGLLEEIPLPDGTADAVISNCVFNLSADKERAFLETHRILKPGGRIAISDTVFLSEPPEGIARSLAAWGGCVAGALPAERLREILERTGFEAIEVTPRGTYSFEPEEAEELFPDLTEEERRGLNGILASANIRGRKPLRPTESGGSSSAGIPADSFRIRPARPEDRKTIQDILEAGDLHSEIAMEEISLFRVAEEPEGRIVGTVGVSIRGEEALLRSLAVDPARRGAGIGGALVRAALEEARKEGALQAWLLTIGAEGYFPRLGFRRRENREYPESLRVGSCAPGLCPESSACFCRKP